MCLKAAKGMRIGVLGNRKNKNPITRASSLDEERKKIHLTLDLQVATKKKRACHNRP